MFYRLIFFSYVFVGLLIYGQANEVMAKEENVGLSNIGRIKNDRILIEREIDLNGNVLILPRNKILCAKGGLLKNGTLIGNETQIEARGNVFDNVTIRGTWNVPKISTRLFANLNYVNSLKDVFALTNSKYHNRVIIEEGDYYVKANKGADVCLPVSSNTDVILNGTIHLVANAYKHYYILNIKGKNIKVRGKGSIIGDRKSHTGNEGEWGMGINLKGAINATISGLTIKDCWGDCIYVGGSSRNVVIENCKLDGGRRQGISITKANGVKITNCLITNVKGANPQFAIDVEPNSKDSVDNILIEKVTARNCKGGFLVMRKPQKSGKNTPFIGGVVIRNCKVLNQVKHPVIIKRCESAKIERCTLNTISNNAAISVNGVGAVVVNDNVIYKNSGGLLEKAISGVKKLYSKEETAINIVRTKNIINNNNRIYQR